RHGPDETGARGSVRPEQHGFDAHTGAPLGHARGHERHCRLPSQQGVRFRDGNGLPRRWRLLGAGLIRRQARAGSWRLALAGARASTKSGRASQGLGPRGLSQRSRCDLSGARQRLLWLSRLTISAMLSAPCPGGDSKALGEPMTDAAAPALDNETPVNPYSLLEAVNRASRSASLAWLLLLAVTAYLGVAVAGIGHRDLLFDADVVLP